MNEFRNDVSLNWDKNYIAHAERAVLHISYIPTERGTNLETLYKVWVINERLSQKNHQLAKSGEILNNKTSKVYILKTP